MSISREKLILQDNVLGWKFVYPTATATKKKWKITSKCLKCSEVTDKWYSRKWTDLCGKCSRGRRTTAEFIAAAIETHGTTYSYDSTVYKNNDTKVEITCSEHGGWRVRPTDFLAGGGCPKCSKLCVSEDLEHTCEEWQEKMVNRYVTIVSKDSREFGTFDCTLHGEYVAKFSNASKSESSGCTACNRLRHSKQAQRECTENIPTTLYWIYMPSVDMYKLGITVQEMQDRFSSDEHIQIIWKETLSNEDAINIESSIHNMCVHDRYRGTKKLLKEGTYELYHDNIFKTYKDAINKLQV